MFRCFGVYGVWTFWVGQPAEGVKKLAKGPRGQNLPIGNQRLTTANLHDCQFFHTFSGLPGKGSSLNKPESQAGGLRYYLNSHATRVALIHSSFWEQTNAGDSTHSGVQVLQAGRLGTLELKAPACEIGALPHQRTQPGERSFGPGVSNERVFEIVSELLAEGWVKAP